MDVVTRSECVDAPTGGWFDAHAVVRSFLPTFSDPRAAAASWPATLDFFDGTLRS